MSVSLAQYVDLLFKKLQGVAKTANATVKSASNESIASPAFLRGDVIWMQSDQIPAIANSIANIANAKIGTHAVQCTADTTVPPIGGVYPTWISNVKYWIPQEFGSTWLPKVFVGPPGAANIESTGTQIFAAGASGTGEYFFDTQAGVLNFIGETIPPVLSTGNVVYVSGYQYIGSIGVTNQAGNVNIGNLKIANTTITTDGTVANIYIQPTTTGEVVINTTTGIVMPVGNTIQRPTGPVGTVRYNTDTNALEVFNGIEWAGVGTTVSNQTITSADGTTKIFALNKNSTSAGTLVIVNGVTQLPDVAYSVTGNVLTFNEAPANSDIVDIRFI